MQIVQSTLSFDAIKFHKSKDQAYPSPGNLDFQKTRLRKLKRIPLGSRISHTNMDQGYL